jgi:DNA end-binding protein Ku
VLADTGKAGISKVIIRTRQHLAAVKFNGNLLVLELMRFEDELLAPAAIKIAKEKEPSAREIAMAKTLVNQMSDEWDPHRYTDDYKSALMKLIDKKVAAGGKALPEAEKKRKGATNVIDLAAVLQESLAHATGKTKGAKFAKPAKARAGRHAA